MGALMHAVVDANETRTDVAPEAAAVVPVARPKPWRLRHPRIARAVLYGGALCVGAVGYAVAMRVREDARQQGLLTRIHGIETTIRPTSPEMAVRLLREEVLAKAPNEDVARRAHLAEAAAFDAMRKFDEAEAAYVSLSDTWPAGRPRGALTLPWANMRVRAGKPADALTLLDAPGATEGETEQDVKSVRDAAQRPLAPFAR